MEFLEKVASFADQYQNSAEAEEGILLKVAADMDVTYADMVALHNVVEGNIFTEENLVKIAEDQEPSRIAMVGELWEKIASDEIGPEGIAEFAAGIKMDDESISFILDALDKQAQEAGIEGFEAKAPAGEEAGITADSETWDKVAEAHGHLVDADLNPTEAFAFAESYMNAENEEEGAGEKVASEYGDLDQETFDKIAQAFDSLSDIENPAELMAEYEKQAASMKGAVDATVAGAKKLYNGDATGAASKAFKKAKDVSGATEVKSGLKSIKGGNIQKKMGDDLGKEEMKAGAKKALKGAAKIGGGASVVGAGAYMASKKDSKKS